MVSRIGEDSWSELILETGGNFLLIEFLRRVEFELHGSIASSPENSTHKLA